MEAAKIHRETLAAWTHVLGTGHPRMLESAEKLATTQRRLTSEEEGKFAISLDGAAT